MSSIIDNMPDEIGKDAKSIVESMLLSIKNIDALVCENHFTMETYLTQSFCGYQFKPLNSPAGNKYFNDVIKFLKKTYAGTSIDTASSYYAKKSNISFDSEISDYIQLFIRQLNTGEIDWIQLIKDGTVIPEQAEKYVLEFRLIKKFLDRQNITSIAKLPSELPPYHQLPVVLKPLFVDPHFIKYPQLINVVSLAITVLSNPKLNKEKSSEAINALVAVARLTNLPALAVLGSCFECNESLKMLEAMRDQYTKYMPYTLYCGNLENVTFSLIKEVMDNGTLSAAAMSMV